MERKSVEHKKNTEQLVESLKQKEQALFLQDIKLHKRNEDFEFAKQIIFALHEEIERKSAEQKKNTEQLVESFKQKEQALLNQNKQLLEHEIRSRDVMVAKLNGKIEKQVG